MTKFASQFGVPGHIWYTGKVVSYVNIVTYEMFLHFFSKITYKDIYYLQSFI